MNVGRANELSDKTVIEFIRINFFLKFADDLVVVVSELLDDFLEHISSFYEGCLQRDNFFLLFGHKASKGVCLHIG